MLPLCSSSVAVPAVTLASQRGTGVRGDVTVKSKAAGDSTCTIVYNDIRGLISGKVRGKCTTCYNLHPKVLLVAKVCKHVTQVVMQGYHVCKPMHGLSYLCFGLGHQKPKILLDI